MSNPFVIRDHGAFHQQVIRLTAVGAALGLVVFLAGLSLIPGSGSLTMLLFAGTIAGLGLAAAPPDKGERIKVITVAVVVGLIAAAGAHFLATGTRVYPWLGIALSGTAIGFIARRGVTDYRRWVIPVALGASTTLGFWALVIFLTKVSLVGYIPAFAASMVAGAVFGFLTSVGLLTAQCEREEDSLMEGYSQLKHRMTGEMVDLMDRSARAYKRIKEAIRERQAQGERMDPSLMRGVERLMQRILDLCRKWESVEGQARRTSADDLTTRIDRLDAKIADAQDAVAKREYQMARDALTAQLSYLRDISRSRERVVARVHNYLATLERVHLAVVNHRGADAAKFSDELSPLISELDDIGSEMDYASEAMNEVAEVVAEKKKSTTEEGDLEAAGDAQADNSEPEEAAESRDKSDFVEAATAAHAASVLNIPDTSINGEMIE